MLRLKNNKMQTVKCVKIIIIGCQFSFAFYKFGHDLRICIKKRNTFEYRNTLIIFELFWLKGENSCYKVQNQIHQNYSKCNLQCKLENSCRILLSKKGIKDQEKSFRS